MVPRCGSNNGHTNGSINVSYYQAYHKYYCVCSVKLQNIVHVSSTTKKGTVGTALITEHRERCLKSTWNTSTTKPSYGPDPRFLQYHSFQHNILPAINCNIIIIFCLLLSSFKYASSVSTTFYTHISFLSRYKIPRHNRFYINSCARKCLQIVNRVESVIHNYISSKSQTDSYCWFT